MLRIEPVDELDDMESETRHPVVCWRTGDMKDRRMKCTRVDFDRLLEPPQKFRVVASGIETHEGRETDKPLVHELKLTMRKAWTTSITKFRGTKSRVRVVAIDFAFDDDRSDNDIIRIEILVPKTSDIDKGKKLKLAVDWAKHVVDAGIAYKALVTALNQL